MLSKHIIVFLAFISFDAIATKILIQSEHFTYQQQQVINKWINHGIKVIENTITEFPHQKIIFDVKKQSNAAEPVPWAEVIRSQPVRIKLHIDKSASLDDFMNDWTLYHELSHLYLPFLDLQSFWLNEGFATYLQYISMLDNGVINSNQFINKMQNGLLRGAIKTKAVPGPLSDVSANMWELRAYKRVYWSGAAFFIKIDNQLIKQGTDLPTVIKQYSKCCQADELNGKQLMVIFDGIINQKIFSSLYDDFQQRHDFPKIPQHQLESLASYYGKR